MKRSMLKILLATLFSLMFVMFSAITTAYADSSNVNVDVDWKHVTFNNDLGYPFIDSHDRTMIPFRAVANFMDGVNVLWSDDSKEAGFYVNKDVPFGGGGGTYHAKVLVRFPIDTNQCWIYAKMYKNNDNPIIVQRLVTMDTNAIIKNSRTYAPIRYLVEGLGYSVNWNDYSRTVNIHMFPDSNWVLDIFRDYSYDQGGKNIVNNSSIAETYAREFLRAGYGKGGNYNLSYLGKDNLGDMKGYVYQATSGTTRKNIFISYNGEFLYSNDDGLEYTLFDLLP